MWRFGCSRRATSRHRTVCEFRRRHLAEFSELFVGVVQVAREMGLARFGKLSVDGTKVRANASKRKASYRIGASLAGGDRGAVTKAGMVDADEGVARGVATQGEGLAAIQAAARRRRNAGATLSAGAAIPGRWRHLAYGEPAPKAQSNFTDPERIMKTSSEGFQQCYNAQMAGAP